jgi:hypothetical protein
MKRKLIALMVSGAFLAGAAGVVADSALAGPASASARAKICPPSTTYNGTSCVPNGKGPVRARQR